MMANGLGRAMDYSVQKEAAGTFATFAWIGSGLYLYLTTHGASLLSWSALGFFVIGMFAAAIVFGIATYGLQRGIAKILVRFVPVPTRGTLTAIATFAWALFAAEAIAIFFTASWVFHQIEPVRAPVPVEHVSDRSSLTLVGSSIWEFTDNEFQFVFQFPDGWSMQKTPPATEYGEVRVLVKHPTKPILVEAIVGQLGKSFDKADFQNNPLKNSIVDAMINFTVEGVYKKTSQDIGADNIIVAEKREIPSDAGVKFYISTLQTKAGIPMAVFGFHIIPFEKPYMITFLAVSPLDKNAADDNATLTRVFNSFHVVGEKPVDE